MASDGLGDTEFDRRRHLKDETGHRFDTDPEQIEVEIEIGEHHQLPVGGQGVVDLAQDRL